MTRTRKALLATTCLAALAFAGTASAAGTSNIIINGTVTGTCSFFNSSYTLDFMALDPTSTTDATASVNVGYRCTAGTAPSSFKIDGNLSPSAVTITNGTTTLPVSLTWTAPTTVGTGFGAALPINIPVTGTIPAASVNAATAGAYAATYSMALLP